MAGGFMGGMQQFFNIEINVPGMDKLDALQEKFQQTNRMARQSGQGMDSMSESTSQAAESADNASQGFGRMFQIGMNIMFLGMAMSMVFGRLAGKMLGMTGAAAALSTSMKTVLLPFFTAITPLVIKLSMALMQLPRPIKFVIGGLVGIMALLGPLLMLLGQVALIASATALSFMGMVAVIGSLVIVILGLLSIVAVMRYAFREFGKVAAIAAGIMSGALLVAILQVTGILPLLAGAFATATGSANALAMATALVHGSMTSMLFTVFALGAALFLLTRVFKKFGPVVGAVATVIGGVLLSALSPIAAILFVVVGVIMTVNKMFKKFGNLMGTIATLVVAAIAVLLAPIIGLPAAIAIALAAVITWFWNMKEEIGRAIHGAIQLILNMPKMIGKMTAAFIRKVKKLGRKAKKWFTDVADKAVNAVGDIITWFKNLPKKIINATSDIASKVQSVGKDIMDGIAQGIKNAPDAIMDAIKSVAPNWVVDVLNKTGSAIQSGVSTVKTSAGKLFNLNDFIMTPNGDLIDYSRNDTIIGTQNPEALTRGGGKVEVNINDPVMKKDADIERLVQEVEDRVNRSTRGRSTGTGIS